jgi:hypothetical protein
MQSAAWDHASPFITDYLTLRASLSAYEQSHLEISTVAQLSFADAIILVQCMGLTDAARLVSLVDPWCYPGSQSPASVGVSRYLQSAVDKASSEGILFYAFLAESVSAYLLSPLLLPKGSRPLLVRKPMPNAVGSKRKIQPVILHPVSPSERAAPVFTATREPAAEPAGAPTPTPDVTPAASLSPTQRFSAGSLVRVLPDTRPGIRPELAEGLLAATFHSDAGEGFSLVSPIGSARRRTIPTNLLVLGCLDGSFRFASRGGGAARDIAKARSNAIKETAKAARSVSKARADASMDVLSAQRRAEKADSAAAKKVARALKSEEVALEASRREVQRAAKLAERGAKAAAAAVSRATSVSSARVASAEERTRVAVVKAAAAASRSAAKLKAAEAAAIASKAESASLFTGGRNGFRLSKIGKKQAAALLADCAPEIERLKRQKVHVEGLAAAAIEGRKKAENLTAAAIAKAVTLSRCLLFVTIY